MERNSAFAPRSHRFKPLPAVYGVAFNSGPIPLVWQACGEPQERPYGLIATDHPGRLVGWLESLGAVVRGGVRQRHIFTARGNSRTTQENAYISSFTWSARYGGNAKVKGNLVLCPAEFTDASISTILGDDESRYAEELALWALDYMEWCREVNVPVRASSGGQSSIFLRDARFWPEPRARISRRFNALAREYLPGNYYRLFNPGKHPVVLEYDQISAHHNSAAHCAMVDSNTLAQANIRDGSDRLICRAGTRDWERMISRPGLHRLLVRINHAELEKDIKFPFLELLSDNETASVWVWSSELQTVFNEPGLEVIGGIATLSSRRSSPGLSNFARWAIGEIERNKLENPHRQKWLKGLLVATYGVMALPPQANIRWSTSIPPNSRGSGGVWKRRPLVISGAMYEPYVFGDRRELAPDPPFVNVLDRGIIEADTRAHSILHARELRGDNSPVNVIAIYSDSLLLAEATCEKQLALIAAEAPSISLEAPARGEKSGSHVPARKSAGRRRRGISPLPGPTRQDGSPTLVARPPDMRIDDGSEKWAEEALSGFLRDRSQSSDGNRWRIKRTLTELEMDEPTRWRAAEDQKLPGTPRHSRPPSAIVSPVGRN